MDWSSRIALLCVRRLEYLRPLAKIGFQGMLSLKKDFPADCVGVRPSMLKFPSRKTILEVKQVARANSSRETKLFNQVLLILSHLRVKNRVFLDLQAMAFVDMASEFDRSFDIELAQRDIAVAYDYIEKYAKNGRKLNKERFSVQECYDLKNMMIKAKTKMNLRTNLTLMQGVIDEHNLLREGEVLVGNGRVQGSVLICRSPCNLPGDIQSAYAVQGMNRYTHLKDVLVFSSEGDRPLADMLAGGDLDGDEYYVIVSMKRKFGVLCIYNILLALPFSIRNHSKNRASSI